MDTDIKNYIQHREFESLKDEPRVILKWATGCGKSKMTIDLVNHIIRKHSSRKKLKVVFVVAERAHIQNWEDEFTKWNLAKSALDLNILCYASLHKLRNTSYDIIVFDEAHHMFTEKRLEVIKSLSAKHVYLLSATLPRLAGYEIEETFGTFKTSSISLKDAINTNVLPEPTVYTVEMTLDNDVVNQEVKTGSGNNLPEVSWADRNKYIFKNIPCVIKCTEYQKYVYLTNTMEYWKRRYELSHSTFHQNRWVNTGSVRKRFMGELKTSIIKDLVKKIPSKRRFVCFCTSVAQANLISKSKTISSRNTSKKNQEIIDAFNAKRTHQIYAVGMITEGMNLTDIDTGIIVQLDGKERLFIQKFGRSMRADNPVVYIFYYKNTQDELYLRNALDNIDKKYVKHITLNQLNSTIK